MIPDFPTEEELESAKIDLESEYLNEALTFLRERLAEGIETHHLEPAFVTDVFDTVLRKFGMMRHISARYIPLQSERANVAHALWAILIAAYAAGARNTRYLREARTSRAERMRQAKAKKGKYDERRHIVREEAQKAVKVEPRLEGARQNSALARKIHPVVNERLRAIFHPSNPKAELMNVEAIRKQLEHL